MVRRRGGKAAPAKKAGNREETGGAHRSADAGAEGADGRVRKPKASKETLEVVSASRLLADYEANEVSAEQKYKGRIIGVSGVVDRIETGAFGGVHVYLKGNRMFSYVHCKLEGSERDAAAKLRKGQKVTFAGKVITFVVGIVSVSDCVFMK